MANKIDAASHAAFKRLLERPSKEHSRENIARMRQALASRDWTGAELDDWQQALQNRLDIHDAILAISLVDLK